MYVRIMCGMYACVLASAECTNRYASITAYMYVCMYVCMYFTYVCMYAFMYI